MHLLRSLGCTVAHAEFHCLCFILTQHLLSRGRDRLLYCDIYWHHTAILLSLPEGRYRQACHAYMLFMMI